MKKIVHELNNLRPWSLFLLRNQDLSEGNLFNFRVAKFFRMLDLENARIKNLPEEVGDLIHLTYLGPEKTYISELPARLGKLRALQTLDIRWCAISTALPPVVLPNLKALTLRHAYNGRRLGKEFCKPGGFPKLEILSVASEVLEEWTELEEGALPSLQYLHFNNCSSLRMLSEGLQYVTTLKHLDLLPLLDDHAESLKPDGGEDITRSSTFQEYHSSHCLS